MTWSTYRYSNPPVIHFGAGSRAALAQELDALNADNVALVTTRSLDSQSAMLPVRPAATFRIGQHAPEADLDRAVAELAGRRPAAIVSFGGGSAVDGAKIIGLRLGGHPPPHIAVPTTLSGAELAAGAGFTAAAGDKVGMRDPRGLPVAVVYDAELVLGTPLELWLSTGIRALDHAVEGYLADGAHPVADVMCLEAVRRLFATLPEAKRSPADGEVRGRNQLAAWFAYTLPGPSAGGLSHVMGKQVGARHGIPHGVTSCILLPHVLRYRAGRQPERAAGLAAATGGDPAEAIGKLVAELDLPRHLAPFGLSDDDLARAAAAVAAGSGGAYSENDVLEIYRAAL